MFKIIIKGVVQGVGFRPYIYRKAKQYNLSGYVKNIGSGVEIVVNDEDFVKKLNDLPPRAQITDCQQKVFNTKKVYSGFHIEKSEKNMGQTILPPDIYMCKDCEKELNDKNDRRNHYYFITCTNCGPRFTIIKDYPYDRKRTSMNEFRMCKECEKEYINPLNRRYHAETIACPKCGPKLKLIKKNRNKNTDMTSADDDKTIQKTAELIRNGEVVAIKGVGGFHLCSTTSNVDKIRKLLDRPDKPFALMVKNPGMVEKFAYSNDIEQELLQSSISPIVVLKKKKIDFFKDISELDSIGVMLPYTPLHHLLMEKLDEPLVMTSANIPGEPIQTDEKIGDYFLTHEREIINRCDDSVLKIINNKVMYLRRSRGYVPLPIKLPINCADTLALGAEMNSIICAAKNDNAFLSQYIGETSKLKTLDYLKETTQKNIKLTRLKPKIIACDLHPDYNSTQYAKELTKKYGARLIQIQHHKAHIASVAAEHGLKNYVGIAMDGTGYGEDGKIWGGEVFSVTDGINFERIGHLEEQPQIGGDFATIYPKKMLLGILSKLLSEKEIIKMKLFDEKETQLYLKQLSQNFNVIQTTSSGRILDATAALLGICDTRTYDGRPAMLLESTSTTPIEIELKFKQEDGKMILLTTPLFEYLIKNIKKGKGVLAATAQSYLARGLHEIAKNEANQKNVKIVFSGGVAYNQMITSFMLKQGVLINKEIPCGDGGISYGQAYLANMLLNNN